MAKPPTVKMVSFAARIIAGDQPSEALDNSLYRVENMNRQSKADFAQDLLQHPSIAEAILKAKEESLRGGQLQRDDMVALLENYATTNIADFLNFESVEFTDDTGRRRKAVIIETKSSRELTPDQLRCITKISETSQGKLSIQTVDPLKAIAQLRQIHGLDAPPKAAVDEKGKAMPAAVVSITREVIDG